MSDDDTYEVEVEVFPRFDTWDDYTPAEERRFQSARCAHCGGDLYTYMREVREQGARFFCNSCTYSATAYARFRPTWGMTTWNYGKRSPILENEAFYREIDQAQAALKHLEKEVKYGIEHKP